MWHDASGMMQEMTANPSVIDRSLKVQECLIEKIVARYERLSKTMVLDACAVATPTPEAAAAQLVGVLTCLPSTRVEPFAEFACSNAPVALWVRRAIDSTRGPMRCGVLGFRSAFHFLLLDADLQWAYHEYRTNMQLPKVNPTVTAAVLRGAIAASGTLRPDGLRLYGPMFQPIEIIAEAAQRLSVPVKLSGANGDVHIGRQDALALLNSTGMVRTARSYVRALQGLPGSGKSVSEMIEDKSKALRQSIAASAARPVFEATKIAMLGDLDQYRVNTRQKATAQRILQLHSSSQKEIAAATHISHTELLRRIDSFWNAVEHSPIKRRGPRRMPERAGILPPQFQMANQARARASSAAAAAKLDSLGDITGIKVPQVLREAAQMRRAYPEASYAELGARLGVSKDVYAGRLRRFWVLVEAEGARG